MGSASGRFGGSGGWNVRATGETNGKGMGLGLRINDIELKQYMKDITQKLKHDLKDFTHDIMRDAADEAKMDGRSFALSLKNKER